jgi:hypothetical protein
MCYDCFPYKDLALFLRRLYRILGCDVMWSCRILLTFRRKLLRNLLPETWRQEASPITRLRHVSFQTAKFLRSHHPENIKSDISCQSV